MSTVSHKKKTSVLILGVNGFIGNADRRLLNELRALPAEQLAQASTHFQDARLDELLFRFRARNFPDSLNEAEHERWALHCADRLHGGAGGATTLASFMEHIDTLAETADERAQALLEALVDYAEGIAPEA